LWALAGGHVGKNETAFEASLRELEEETGLKIPGKVLIGSFQGEKLFDHPERSLRGRCGKKVSRTVSISHCYVLNDEHGLPRVKGMDDAEEAWWFPIAEVRKMRNEMFEDHVDQINYWLARVDDKKYR
jgi:bifunctional NMN adenylyltransferase/nudix hydrolase